MNADTIWQLYPTPARETALPGLYLGHELRGQHEALGRPFVYTNYVTAWATREGVVHFRDDIYARDGVDELQITSSL